MTESQFKVAVIGLGLMGGSFAYALKGFRNCSLIGYDRDRSVLQAALSEGAVSLAADSLKNAVKEADLVLFCTYPGTIADDIRSCTGYFKKGAVVTDISGVKQHLQASLPQDYIGLHPMAGKETGGFARAEAGLFQNTGFILVPQKGCRQDSINLLRELAEYVGASRICINSPPDHDRIIAYTSDLMHIAAAALCVDYPTDMTMAHTAGAFRDCTRIAEIDADLWTDLLLLNRNNIIPLLEKYIANLSIIKESLINENKDFMHDILETACKNKQDMQRL